MAKPSLSAKVLTLLAGKRLATAESLTGGGIGQAITAVSGASAVFAGGVISYTNEIKEKLLGVSCDSLEKHGAVSGEVAGEMVSGVRKLMYADVAVSVTGLAGPDGDDFGHPVGTVYIGYEDDQRLLVRRFNFDGDRNSVRLQTIEAALSLILQYNQ